MESFIAIRELMESHNLKKSQVGNLRFEALIEYQSALRHTSGITTVTIIRNGYQDGEIKIEELGELNSDNFHLDFDTKHQKYSFLKVEKSLLISGSSKKMGGKYRVYISPSFFKPE